MKLRGAFNIFLVLVLVSIGVYFVTFVTAVNSGSFTTPSTNNEYIRGNYTFFITLDDSIHNVSNWTVFNVTPNSVVGGVNTSIFHTDNKIFNLSLAGAQGNAQDPSIINFTLNTHNFTDGRQGRGDGNYTFMVMFANETGNLALGMNFTNITVLIDNTPPSELSLIYPNISATFVDNTTLWFAFNVTDSMSGNHTFGELLNCSLIIDGSSVNSSIVVSNQSAFNVTRTVGLPNETEDVNTGGESLEGYGNYSFWFNVSAQDIDSGYHTWNITCWDKANNYNETAKWPYHDTLNVNAPASNHSGGNFTLTDNIAPTTATPSLSATSITSGGSVTITCTGTDAITANPTEFVSIKSPGNADWAEDIAESPHTYSATTTIGTYYVRCRSRDTANNYGPFTSENSFEVTKSARGTNPGDGGGPPSEKKKTVYVMTGQTRDLGNIVGGEGVINAFRASTATFTVKTSSETSPSSHSVRFDEVSYIDKQITITLSSDPVTLTMSVGDTENVDIDGDGVEDLEVVLNDVDSNGKVNMNIKDLVTITAGEEPTPTEPTPAEKIGKGMAWYWWILIIVVIVIIIALILPKKKK